MTLIEILESRKEALNVEQVAELLGVSEKKIYRLAAAGALPSFRVGSAIRFDGQDIADWLRKKKPSDEQPTSRKLQKDGGPRLHPKGHEGILPDRIWRNKVRSLELALVAGSSSGGEAKNS